MRFVFAALDNFGHVYPVVPLALAARDAGHDVLFATGSQLAPRLERAGLRTAAVLPDALWGEAKLLERQPELRDVPPQDKPRLAYGMFGDILAEAAARDLLPVLRSERPDAVVFESYALGAGLAAALHGVPRVVHSLNQPWPPPMVASLRDGAVWSRVGGRGEPPDVFDGEVYVEIRPPLLRDAPPPPSAAVVEVAPVPWSEGGELPSWVPGSRDRRLAYLTLGTVVFGNVAALRAAATGLASLDLDVLVTVGPAGDPAAVDGLGERVRAERFVAQDEVLRHADVVVSHCGSGTMLGALTHGVPHLALPQGADQFYNAEQLAGSGAGLSLMPDEITEDAVADAVRRLLDEPSFAARTVRARDEIAAMPTPADAITALVEAVSAVAR